MFLMCLCDDGPKLGASRLLPLKMNQLVLLSWFEPAEDTSTDSSDLPNPSVYPLQNMSLNVDTKASRC